jgi:hypothetical protein
LLPVEKHEERAASRLGVTAAVHLYIGARYISCPISTMSNEKCGPSETAGSVSIPKPFIFPHSAPTLRAVQPLAAIVSPRAAGGSRYSLPFAAEPL